MPIYPDTNDQRRIYNSDAKTLLQNWVEEVKNLSHLLAYYLFKCMIQLERSKKI